ncbi:MAG: alpha-glucosidase/alpha-galactosidase [Lachnospiraceae bacterium]
MLKVTFLGAGSTIFARNVLGDMLATPTLENLEIALYDINQDRLRESEQIIGAINKGFNSKAVIRSFAGVMNRKEALRNADFVVNAIQVGGYDPCTITDFEVPKKYGLRQTIGDTLGIGGIMRALRTIPVLEDFAKDIEEVCPEAWFLNYTNPMGMLTGYMQRYTNVKTIGLCHSVQVASQDLLKDLGMEDKIEGRKDLIAGINHMGWLLEIKDRDGNDLYPEIKKRAQAKNAQEKHKDMVRYDYIDKFGYYCTESSEHNAEYNMFYIKDKYPERIEHFNIPLDEYPRRCVTQIEEWSQEYQKTAQESQLKHERSHEYASYIVEAMVMNQPIKIGANVVNTGGLISNLPQNACVEVPCLVDGTGIYPCSVGALPSQLAAMNMTNVNVQLLTIEAARTRKLEHVYHAAYMDPHTASELSLEKIQQMVDELIARHGDYLPRFS